MISIISLIVKSYLAILIPIGLGAICVFMACLYWIIKINFLSQQQKNETQFEPIEEKNSEKFIFETQVDLASPPTPIKEKNETVITFTDLNAISGDDVVATQLDLARAYIESGKKNLALKILEQVLKQGSNIQQVEAQRLIGLV